MTDLEFSYFLILKTAVQNKYLETHSPSFDDISKWRGIDIVYFQEDLRQKAKGNISEKTFYTYFKNNSQEKIPRIDMLNILANYSGYASWSDFKKKNPIQKASEDNEGISKILPQEKEISSKKDMDFIPERSLTDKQKIPFYRKHLWLGMSIFLFAIVLFLVFYDSIFYKEYTYTFIDADRNSSIKGQLDVKIIRENESPILFEVAPNSPFIYKNRTKSKSLKMEISSPFYKSETIIRDLTNAPENENIELKPNEYAIQLYYYSKSIKDFKKKTKELNKLISDNALIYQVVDSDIYGIETMDKQKYISLVTLPTTSLENLEVIDTQMDKGKIIMIKFRIRNNEKAE